MNHMLRCAAAVLAISLAGAGMAASTHKNPVKKDTAEGVWQQIDPDTGRVGAYVTIREHDGLYEGTFTKLFLKPDDPPNPTCDGCKGDQKGHSFIGLKFMYNLERHGLNYTGGTIIDPRDGSEYGLEMTLSPDGETLTVRGYLGISLFGSSQDWKRLDKPPPDLDPSHPAHKPASNS